MRILFWGLGLAVLAALVANLARLLDGNVVVMLPPYRIDIAINLALTVVAGFLLVGHVIGRILTVMLAFPDQVRLYRERRAELGAQRALRNALQALLEGRFARAERAAKLAQSMSVNAGIAALIGARAAHRMQEYERRERWLEEAAVDPELSTARLVSSAEMWAESRENARALEAIDRMESAGARHIHTLRIALTARLQAGEWEEVIRAVHALEKRRAIHQMAGEKFKRLAWLKLLAEREHDTGALEVLWARIPSVDRTNPDLAQQAARMFAAAGLGRAAMTAIEAALAASWDDRLLDAYASITNVPTREQIERVEGWLQRRPHDAALLRCLGRICLAAGLWGKARSTLEESRRQVAAPATVLALAQLAEAVDDPQSAARLYREAAYMLSTPPMINTAGQLRGSSREVAL